MAFRRVYKAFIQIAPFIESILVVMQKYAVIEGGDRKKQSANSRILQLITDVRLFMNTIERTGPNKCL